MSTTLSLTRFNKDLTQELDIAIEEWATLENEIAGIKFQPNEGAYHCCINVYSEKAKEWIPIFYIEKNGHGEQKFQAMYFDETTYNKGIEIAKKLGAVIWCEDSTVIYHPEFGEFNDVYHEDAITISLEDLGEYISLYGYDDTHFKEFLDEKHQKIMKVMAAVVTEEKKKILRRWLLMMAIFLMLYFLLLWLFS